nr:hypothetical protein [Tanacetum cinerariifolium]
AGKGGNVTEVELKRMAGKSGLTATVLAFQTGETVTVGKFGVLTLLVPGLHKD